MPTVPRVQRQVEVGALPSIRTSPDAPIEAFGGGAAAAGVGRAANQLAEGGIKIYEEEKQKANDTWSTDYYTKLSAKKQELFWDPKSGVMTQKGKDSFTAPDTYGKQFDDFANGLEDGATSEQKAIAQRIRAKERMEFDGQILRHVSGESQTYQKQTVEAGIQVARNDAVLNYNDPSAVQDKIKLQEALYMQTSPGKPAALVELEMKDLRSKTHASVVSRMIDNGSDQQASAYFKNHRGEFSGEDIDNVEKALASGTLAGESQRQSDAIYSSSTGLSDALSKAKGIQEPKLRDETTRRVKDLYAVKKLADDERDEKNHQYAGNVIDQTGSTDRIPRNIWNQFSVAERASLNTYAKSRREGTQVPANSDKYIDMTLIAANPATRNEFAKMPISKLRGQVTDGELKELLKTQAGILKGDPQTKSLLGSLETNNQILTRTLKSAKVEPTSEDGREFFRKINRIANEQFESTGKRPTGEEVQALADGLLIEGVQEKRSLFGIDMLAGDTVKRTFQLKDGETFQDVEPGKIPAAEKSKIVDYLNRNKKPVTDANILKLFNLKFGSIGANSP